MYSIDIVNTKIYDERTMNTTIQMRVDSATKSKAQKIFADLGLDMSSGIKLFLSQVVHEKGLPFTVSRDPKKIREKWDKEVAWALKHGKGYTSAEAMFKDILKG